MAEERIAANPLATINRTEDRAQSVRADSRYDDVSMLTDCAAMIAMALPQSSIVHETKRQRC